MDSPALTLWFSSTTTFNFQFHWMDSYPGGTDSTSSMVEFFQFHWMDSGYNLGVITYVQTPISFNSIEWILKATTALGEADRLKAFNSIEWIRSSLTGTVNPVENSINFQFHWMDSQTPLKLSNTLSTTLNSFNSIEWIPLVVVIVVVVIVSTLSIPLNGFVSLRWVLLGEEPPRAFNSIEWIQRDAYNR